MADDDPSGSPKAEEIVEIVREIRERVRARHPGGAVGNVTLPDLMPVLHARDRAEAKVAAIGAVNPRMSGPLNALIQGVKKLVARLLNWHIRDQVEFNRATVSAIDAVLEALSENNRALARMGVSEQEAVAAARELKDICSHWEAWRVEWERKLAINEIQFLRSVADLRAAFEKRTFDMEAGFRDSLREQHKEFGNSLGRTGIEIQQRLWTDLEKIRGDYERLIHAELRLLRQRTAVMPREPAPTAPSVTETAPPPVDFMWFAERFRGSEEYVREKQKFYVPFFQGRREVLDLGCGRGEFLELMKETSVPARGIDLSAECVALARSKGLQAEQGDVFSCLHSLADCALDGIFSAQVVEHLAPERLPELIRLAASKLETGGLLVIETPNPECLAALTTHFYLDPTHSRPVPSALLRFYMEESGFGRIEVHRLSPAVESMPSLAGLPEGFREAFFGGLDYAILGRKL